MKNIFITGANGVLGSRIASELLLNTPTHITCLIRAKSHEEGFQRIKKQQPTHINIQHQLYN